MIQDAAKLKDAAATREIGQIERARRLIAKTRAQELEVQNRLAILKQNQLDSILAKQKAMEEELQRGRRNLENAHKLADDDVSHDNFVLLPYVYMLLFNCMRHAHFQYLFS